jgi:hypothetical protein
MVLWFLLLKHFLRSDWDIKDVGEYFDVVYVFIDETDYFKK